MLNHIERCLRIQLFPPSGRYAGRVAAEWLTDDEQAAWRAYLLAFQLLWEDLDRQL